MELLTRVAPLVFLLPSVLAATNNWNVPCFTGKCSYDLVGSSEHGVTTGALLIVRYLPQVICTLTKTACTGWFAYRRLGHNACRRVDHPRL